MSDTGNRNSSSHGVPDASEAATAMSRNTLWNLLGAGIPLLLALLTLPILIRTIGTERFGVLAIVWVILGYFGLFDLGLGRATTYYIARDLEKGLVASARANFWTSLLANGALGILGAVVLAALTPTLTGSVLDIPTYLGAEARAAFLLISLSVPLMTLTTAARGVLEARHSFRLLNTLQIPLSATTYVVPLLILPFSVSLTWITAGLLLSRLVGAFVFLIAAVGQLHSPVSGPFFDRTRLRAMLSYGGWLTVTNVVGPIMVYADRLIIGSLASMSAVTYYATSHEAVTRLWILPHSLVRTLFPIFSAGVGLRRRTTIYAKAIKQLTLVLTPVVVTVVVFAPDLLRLWIDETFAERSTLVLQILAAGVLFNSLAMVPYTLIQGLGRPDVTAKFHLLELPFYALFLWVGIRYWGIAGAAVAWTVRVGVDGLLLALYARTSRSIGPTPTGSRLSWTLGLGALVATGGWVLSSLTDDPFFKAIFLGVLFTLSGYVTWRALLTQSERKGLGHLYSLIVTRASQGKAKRGKTGG